ncbi:MAG: YlbF family regulator [Erysipelotrichaceae bacterium]|jgi:cell fate (sporulation/competence/biofilm development) regulator YlbF (YheA/YmcA/DUF963 family)|nr:YlbF family regulator [Erysipelotrichaceae bacterium]
MDEVLEKVKELKKAIDDTPEMQEYLKNKTFLETNSEIIELKHNIANLRAAGKFTEAANLEQLYNAHPIINNYEASKEALYQLLKTIESLIK